MILLYTGRHFRKFQMPNVDKHNKLSADGRTMSEGCFTDFSTTISTIDIKKS